MFILGSIKVDGLTIDNCLINGFSVNTHAHFITPKGEEGLVQWRNLITPILLVASFTMEHYDDNEYKLVVKVK